MADLILRDVDPEKLTAEITQNVVAALTKVLVDSAEPMSVDAERMAKLSGLSRPTIDRAVREGTIPSFKVGRRRLFQPKKVIEAFASQSEKGAADE